MIDTKKIKKWVTENYGEQCKEFSFGCPLCQAWLSYYYLFEPDNENIKFNADIGWHLIPIE